MARVVFAERHIVSELMTFIVHMEYQLLCEICDKILLVS